MTKADNTWKEFRYHSRTFSTATLLLPRQLRRPVASLYLFCRHIDDIADNQILLVGPSKAADLLDDATQNLESTLAGQPPSGVLWHGLYNVHKQYVLRPEPMLELVAGADWDIQGRPIDTVNDLIEYSNLVGGSIGAMMLPLLGSPSTAPIETPARSAGVAMQITNILRDVGEDRRRLGRTYIPARLAARYGVDLASIQRPNEAYARLLEQLMELAEEYYTRGLPGIRFLPPRSRRGIDTATRMYREILNEIRANDYDNLSRRAFVSPMRKAAVMLRDGYAGRRALLRSRHPRLS